MGARYTKSGQQLLTHVARQECLGPERHHTRYRQALDGEQGAEVEILGEDDLPLPWACSRITRSEAFGSPASIQWTAS